MSLYCTISVLRVLIIYAAYAFRVSTAEYVWTQRPAAGARYWRGMASSADGMKLIAGTDGKNKNKPNI